MKNEKKKAGNNVDAIKSLLRKYRVIKSRNGVINLEKGKGTDWGRSQMEHSGCCSIQTQTCYCEHLEVFIPLLVHHLFYLSMVIFIHLWLLNHRKPA